MKNEALEHVLSVLGGVNAAARAISSSPQKVSAWRKRGKVPLEGAIDLELAANESGLVEKICPESARRIVLFCKERKVA